MLSRLRISGPGNIESKLASHRPNRSPSKDSVGTPRMNAAVWQNLRRYSRKSISMLCEPGPLKHIARFSEIGGSVRESPTRLDTLVERLPNPQMTKHGQPPSSFAA